MLLLTSIRLKHYKYDQCHLSTLLTAIKILSCAILLSDACYNIIEQARISRQLHLEYSIDLKLISPINRSK